MNMNPFPDQPGLVDSSASGVSAPAFALAHWRRTVAEMYARVRQAPEGERLEAWHRFRTERNTLFRAHSQSPLTEEQRAAFAGLAYYPYQAAWRIMGRVDPHVKPYTLQTLLPEGILVYKRVGRVHFDLPEGIASPGRTEASLEIFWLEGYGGGLFLPLKDETNGRDTYGGGRYLYDTIKGADLGAGPSEIVLDFNYAYNPSCAYNHQWVCPLAPPENRLPFPIEAGEKLFTG